MSTHHVGVASACVGRLGKKIAGVEHRKRRIRMCGEIGNASHHRFCCIRMCGEIGLLCVLNTIQNTLHPHVWGDWVCSISNLYTLLVASKCVGRLGKTQMEKFYWNSCIHV